MFEGMTYETILTDMLSRVTNEVDKREGSIIYDALAPCAYQLAQIYFQLDNYIDLFYLDTAIGEFLDRKVADYGIIRKSATCAVRMIETTRSVNIGTRWSLNDTTYVITSLLSENAYAAKCEQMGMIGNTYNGTLEDIDNVGNITAMLTEIIVSGEDAETDENLRTRCYAQIQKPSTSGNADQYRQWALEVSGVGNAKIFSLWNGPGTVKVVIVNNEKQPASTALVTDTTEYIEKVRPIGATVTVVSGVAKQVNAKATIILASGYGLQGVLDDFKKALSKYLKSIAFEINYVSLAKIGTLLLNIGGVVDYSSLTLNGGISNISLADEEIPVLGIVDLGV